MLRSENTFDINIGYKVPSKYRMSRKQLSNLIVEGLHVVTTSFESMSMKSENKIMHSFIALYMFQIKSAFKNVIFVF